MRQRQLPSLALIALFALLVQVAGSWVSAQHQAKALVAGTPLAICVAHPDDTNPSSAPGPHDRHCPLCAGAAHPPLLAAPLLLSFTAALAPQAVGEANPEPAWVLARHAPPRAPPSPLI